MVRNSLQKQSPQGGNGQSAASSPSVSALTSTTQAPTIFRSRIAPLESALEALERGLLVSADEVRGRVTGLSRRETLEALDKLTRLIHRSRDQLPLSERTADAPPSRVDFIELGRLLLDHYNRSGESPSGSQKFQSTAFDKLSSAFALAAASVVKPVDVQSDLACNELINIHDANFIPDPAGAFIQELSDYGLKRFEELAGVAPTSGFTARTLLEQIIDLNSNEAHASKETFGNTWPLAREMLLGARYTKELFSFLL